MSYPGVYIDEFAPGAPIQGVSTSNAAFIGPASRGDLDTPTKLASWDAFQERFGPPVPGFFMWYAVRGYFQNGGQICYIVRASNGDYAKLTLQNRGNHDMVEVRAREPGDPTPPLQVEIVAANVLQSADWTLFQPTGTFTVTAIPRDSTGEPPGSGAVPTRGLGESRCDGSASAGLGWQW